MSINSNKLQELTEEVIGEERSEHFFGRPWKHLYESLAEENLTEEKYKESLAECKFKDPDTVGLLSLICPLLCLDIAKLIITNKAVGMLYEILLIFWYFMMIIEIIDCIVNGKMSDTIIIMLLCLVSISWTFRQFSRQWNAWELIYHSLRRD